MAELVTRMVSHDARARPTAGNASSSSAEFSCPWKKATAAVEAVVAVRSSGLCCDGSVAAARLACSPTTPRILQDLTARGRISHNPHINIYFYCSDMYVFCY